MDTCHRLVGNFINVKATNLKEWMPRAKFWKTSVWSWPRRVRRHHKPEVFDLFVKIIWSWARRVRQNQTEHIYICVEVPYWFEISIFILGFFHFLSNRRGDLTPWARPLFRINTVFSDFLPFLQISDIRMRQRPGPCWKYFIDCEWCSFLLCKFLGKENASVFNCSFDVYWFKKNGMSK